MNGFIQSLIRISNKADIGLDFFQLVPNADGGIPLKVAMGFCNFFICLLPAEELRDECLENHPMIIVVHDGIDSKGRALVPVFEYLGEILFILALGMHVGDNEFVELTAFWVYFFGAFGVHYYITW